ncbi:MAG TPA: NAD(P)/FAD-dependent oxidoreductase [Gemmataceae bacterium]|nr:NAD(P)/FAD-dependent oxidoreductase [Gemmataceae bacterium]
MTVQPIDTAVVGAGVSGLYAAWRLKKASPDKTIVVYEASGRVGGRLLSVRPPGIPKMVAELGGMRILPAVQPRIKRLLEVLNKELPSQQTIETFDFPVDEPQNLAYLRGVHLRLSDFTSSPDTVPYALTFYERGMKPSGVILSAIEQIVPGVTRPGLTEEQRRQLTRQTEFGGVPLYQQGFWNVLVRVVSGESYQLGFDAGGYSSTLINWNACDAIPWYLSDFGVDAKYQGFRKGFQEVPKVLAELFKKAGGNVRLEAPLGGFRPSEGGFELRIGGETVVARELILAMPRRALELLTPSSPPLQEIQDLVESVTPRPLFKLFTTYKSPWWRSAGFIDAEGKLIAVEAGRSVTDLPVRQTYYWPHDDGKPVREGPAMLLASYDDGGNVGFWDGLRPRRRRQARPTVQEVAPPVPAFQGTQTGQPRSSWDLYKAPAPMVAEVARQLAMIHGLAYTPEVQDAAFRDWGEDPFGGGWNSWNIGVKSWEIKAKIVKPFDAHRLFICGEAYSDAQGWVEGALQTADMVLDKFDLKPL